MKHLLRIVLLCSLLLCACSKSIETAVINADGMTVQVDVRDGHRALLAQLGDWELADSTLFRVDIRTNQEKGEIFHLKSTDDWASVTMSKEKDGYLLSFTGPESIPDAEALTINLRIKSPSDKSLKWYEASETFASDKWTQVQIAPPSDGRHGCVIPVTEEEYWAIAGNF